MGWNIYLFHTRVVVGAPTSNSSSSQKRLSWQQNQNRSNRGLGMASLPVTPVHSLKIAYFLADTTEVEVPQLLDARYVDCAGDVDRG